MDTKPPEQESEETRGKEKIPVGKKEAKVISRFLNDQIFSEFLKTASTSAGGLVREATILAEVAKIEDVLNSLSKKSTKLIREPDAPWGLEFTDTDEPEGEAEEGEIYIPSDQWEKIGAGLKDKINTPLTTILMASEMEGEKAQNITDATLNTSEKFNSIIEPMNQGVRLVTDAKGTTTLLPLATA